MLSPYRVLDLTQGAAALGPMMLADLAADVIKIEPAAGASDRFAPSDPRWLEFAAYNRKKRGITVDLGQQTGRDAFRDLVTDADFLFENAAPGAMAALGLGFDDLRRVNPRIIYVATSAFGQDGPYAGHLSSDLTLAAMGGLMALTGEREHPPLRISVPQTWLHAAAESAVAALIAHRRMLQTGEGQFVDVSTQAAVIWTLMNGMTAFAIQGSDFERNGLRQALGTINLKVLYECADGYTIIAPNLALPVLLRWMIEEGTVPPSWRIDEDWPTYFPRLLSRQPVTHSLDEVCERIEALTRRYSRRELLDRGLPLGVFFAPVNTVGDLLSFTHLEARNYWQPLTLPNGQTVRAPGPFVRFSRTPIGPHAAAPPAGARAAKPAAERIEAGPYPFSGLKVADFSWVGVGPITAKYLADHGATTIHIESSTRPDILRQIGPFKDGVIGPNRSHYFGVFNTSKWSLALDLKHPAGQQIARRLLAWADVALESFTPGTMAALGLGYEAAREANPRIIMASTCLMGQTGPAASLGGYGFHAAAISGFVEITGRPDQPPSGPWSAYTDTVANRFLVASILAALDHRRRTGEGQYIEQSQMESSLHFLAPEILGYQISGATAGRHGNDSPAAAPHNVYPCDGSDQWCAIAVETDEKWRSLRTIMDNPPWMQHPALASSQGRLARRAEIDGRIAEWTRPQERYALMERLQAAGVPAGAVQRSSDLLSDPQLAHRRFFRPLSHVEMGEVPYEGHQFRIRGYDSGPRFAAPCLGEHTFQALREMLGMSDEEIAESMTSGALA
jgi:crotonobetainyl-CoA:carnitine CoA-transferase CaiB-like acyl-CoA transferase